jgi:hypothetical protein
MRGPGLVVWLAVGVALALVASCSPPLAPLPSKGSSGGERGAVYFDALPPLAQGSLGGSGGRGPPIDARTPQAAGGGGGTDLPEPEPEPEDAAVGVAMPDAKLVAKDAGPVQPSPDAAVLDARAPDGPIVRPGITTLTLDVSGLSTRGVLTVAGYGGFAFPFNPALPKRVLATISASTIVNLVSKNHITCHATEAEAIKFISSTPVTGLGAATVVELRVDMPLHIAGDTFEHLPTEFCVGFRRAGAWTWQPMPLQAFLMRDAGRALLVASIGPQPAGSPGVDALGVLAEGGAVVRTIEIDIRR